MEHSNNKRRDGEKKKYIDENVILPFSVEKIKFTRNLTTGCHVFEGVCVSVLFAHEVDTYYCMLQRHFHTVFFRSIKRK